LRQQRAFRSPAQEAAVAVLRTADVVRRRLAAAVEPAGVTLPQYNVLRILRGAHPEPLTTSAVAERLIEQTPGVTRLLDRLEAQGWVARARCHDDRRLVHCRVTAEGLALLERLDPVVDAADDAALGALGRRDLAALTALLARVRQDAGRRDAAGEGAAGERPDRDRPDSAPRDAMDDAAHGAHPAATRTT
jgi:DNA-binding MarR family transcriptional regulator